MRELRKSDYVKSAPTIYENSQLEALERLIKVRNPWGDRAPNTWKGAFGAEWAGWDFALRLELGVVNRDGVKM